MLTILKIAWRNVWRSRRRSFVLLTAVAFGLWAGLFIMSFYNGLIKQRIETAITTEVSHIQVHNPRFREDYRISYIIPEGNKLLAECKNIPGVKNVTSRLVLHGMLASPAGSTGVIIHGITPDSEDATTKLQSKLTKGKYFDNSEVNELIISESLAQKLRLSVHKKAVITFEHLDGELISAAFKIVALYKTNNRPYDETYIFVNAERIDTLAGINDEIHEIALVLHHEKYCDSVQQHLIQKSKGLEVLRWDEITPELGLTVNVGNQMAYIFMGIILISLVFGIINTMMMSVLERTAEFGVLLAVGMSRPRIFMMILAETFFLVMAGCPPGIFFGWITTFIAGKTGITLTYLEQVSSSFGYSPTIYPFLYPSQLGLVVVLVFVSALISSIFPARKAIMCEPAKSIKK